MADACWLTEKDVVGLISLQEALEPLEAGLKRLETDGGVSIPKAMHAWGGGSLHSLGAFDPVLGLGCFKTWVNTPKGAAALLMLYDTDTGSLRAVIEAGALGSMRTSGVTALATRELSASDADEVAILGSGRQALSQLGAIALVRDLKRVRLWSPTAEKRIAAAKMASERFGLNVVAVETLEEAVKDVPIIASVTRSKEPFLSRDMLGASVHLNAVGAVLPGFAEVEPDVMTGAEIIVADNVPTIMALHEMKSAMEQDPSVSERFVTLSSLLAEPGKLQPKGPRLSIFKSAGLGMSDLAVAGEVLRRAEAGNVGSPIGPQVPMPPRWRK